MANIEIGRAIAKDNSSQEECSFVAPKSIEVPRYAAICIAILNRTPYGLPSFPRPVNSFTAGFIAASMIYRPFEKANFCDSEGDFPCQKNVRYRCVDRLNFSGLAHINFLGTRHKLSSLIRHRLRQNAPQQTHYFNYFFRS